MRELILVAGAAIALSGCGQDQAAENTVNVDSAAAVGEISSNDTTAIDAATGDDANMAADVNYTIPEEGNEGDNASADEPDRTSPRRTVRPEPTDNSTNSTNAIANSD